VPFRAQARGRQETKNGLKSNILNKIKDTIFGPKPSFSSYFFLVSNNKNKKGGQWPKGQKNIILKGKYGKENLNNNFELKLRMNQAPLGLKPKGQRLREEFNVQTPWPVAPWCYLGAREKLTKMNQMYQTLKIKQPKTSPFLGITRGLKNISAQMQPQHPLALPPLWGGAQPRGKGTKIFFHTRCRAINRIGPHNTDIISTIFGLLLGDGYAINRTGEGVRISIKQSIIHKEYLFSLYEFFFLRGYCSNLIPRKYNRTIKGRDKIYSGYEFNTFTFRSFVWIYNSFL